MDEILIDYKQAKRNLLKINLLQVKLKGLQNYMDLLKAYSLTGAVHNKTTDITNVTNEMVRRIDKIRLKVGLKFND